MAGTWNFWMRAKENLGKGMYDFDTRTLRITLHTDGASANLASAGVDITVLGSVGNELEATNGYAANGENISGGAWTVSGTNVIYTGPNAVAWTAAGDNLGSATSLKYAVIHASLAGGTRSLLCYVTLSDSVITVAAGSVLTINSGGGRYFTLT